MAVELSAPAHEQTRARSPDESGYIERDGVRVYYEVYGSGDPTVLLLPTWSLLHSRHWKMQIPYLARHCKVVTFDGRGNGRSDRPQDAAAYDEHEFAADALAVLDVTETERAVLVGFSLGGQRGLLLAAEQPERIDGAVFIGPRFLGGGEPLPERTVYDFDAEYDTAEGWAKHNRFHWLRDYRDWVEFFISKMFTEPHSTKPIEDAVGWGLETDAETMIATQDAPALTPEEWRALTRRVRCPVLVIHGDCDAINSVTCAEAFADQTGGQLVVLEGSGHAPHIRDPVKVNLLLRDFVAPPKPAARWRRGKARRKRALYISSPIGLGHAQRDAAIADELRKLHPGPGDRLAGAASGHSSARGARRAHPSGERIPCERVDAHRERVGRARPALLPGHPSDGRDPARELHGLPRPRPRRGLRPLDRRRGLGARLLPAREPGAEARRVRVADRLRRLAADSRTAAIARRS